MQQPPFVPYPFEFTERTSRPSRVPWQASVAIIGGGIAGLTCALALSVLGIEVTVIEADKTVCFGSRAICISRRSLEIFDRYGIAGEIMRHALSWTGGRSYFRDHEVLHFLMSDDENQKFPPMINIAQYRIEEILVGALEQRHPGVDIQWGCRVSEIDQTQNPIRLTVSDDAGTRLLCADWVLGCDGARSMVRQTLGLRLQGTAYEGRYVIVDILMRSERQTERLAWFDPPSNPGSTILMHKEPDDVWRIDYQLLDGQDPVQATSAEHVAEKVRAHLAMIGETAPWSLIWISLYKANALTLEKYRHGRILFAGDAAHLVPIFGVRGANSAIDDADNLAWKLAAVIQGKAGEGLLDSYSQERRHAADENLKSGMKSTEFMAPPTLAFAVMRDAVLSLAGQQPALRSLINPRQTRAICYVGSPLNAVDSQDAQFSCGPKAGEPLHCYPIDYLADGKTQRLHLTDLVQPGRFLLLSFGAPLEDAFLADLRARFHLIDVKVAVHAQDSDGPIALDRDGRIYRAYDAYTAAYYLIRPDGHVLGRWRSLLPLSIEAALHSAVSRIPEHAE